MKNAYFNFYFLSDFYVNLLDSRIDLLFFIKEKPFNRLLLVKSEHQQVEGISFLLACYNESETVQDTLSSVLSLEYPEKKLSLSMMEVLIILLKSSMNSRKIMILNLLTSKSIEVKLMHSMRESNKHLTNMLCA